MAVLLMESRAIRTKRTETVAKRHCKRYQDLLHVNFLSKICIVRYSSWQHLAKHTPASVLIVKQVAYIRCGESNFFHSYKFR